MRALWFLCALAACDDGVVIEVRPAPGVATDTVQLVVGLATCDRCPGIQPPLARTILAGNVRYREDANGQTVVRTAKVEGGVARFKIEASERGDRIPFAVAVDANQQSAAMLVDIPLDTAGRYQVDLIPAGTTLGPKPATATGNFVQIWQQPGGKASCMGFERWDGGMLVRRTFVVPESDLDCDNRVRDECAPYGFEAIGIPTFEETSCVLPEPQPGGFPLCKLGGPACDDITDTEHPCSPGEYCMPSRYCDVTSPTCANAMGAAGRDLCLFDTPPPQQASLSCTLGYKPASGGTHADACGDTIAFEIATPIPTPTPVSCVGPSGPLLVRRPSGDDLAFENRVTFTSIDVEGEQHTTTLEMRHATGCTYKVDYDGEIALGLFGPTLEPVFAQLWLARAGAVHKLLVPVTIRFVENCEQPTSCTLVLDPNDSLARCLR
ncbi:MAG TPA: hypothetical protein VK427_10880 [Kofleriaceae bacterium]|nr:hypothetical protein [Kofleriaceae bacterium]